MMEGARKKLARWIMTSAPKQFDFKLSVKDLGPQFLIDGVVVRKVVIDTAKLDEQLAMYQSERDEEGEHVYLALLDEQFTALMKEDPAFKASITHMTGENTMPAQHKPTSLTRGTTPQAPVAAHAAPAETPKAPSHMELAMQKAAAKQQNAKAAQNFREKHAATAQPAQAPGVATTPPAVDEHEKARGQALVRLTNVEERTKALHDALTGNRLFSRLTALEAKADILGGDFGNAMANVNNALADKDETIAGLARLVVSLTTRIEDIEAAVATYIVGTMETAPAVEPEIDYAGDGLPVAHAAPQVPRVTPQVPPVRAPAAPAAPKVQRAIPAKGTGVGAQFDDDDCRTMAEMYNNGAGMSMKAIARQFDIRDAGNGFNAKLVWHCINRVKA